MSKKDIYLQLLTQEERELIQKDLGLTQEEVLEIYTTEEEKRNRPYQRTK